MSKVSSWNKRCEGGIYKLEALSSYDKRVEAYSQFKMNEEMQLQQITKRFLAGLSTDERNELRYEVTVTEPKDHIIDAYEIADLTIQDHYTGKQYSYSIWKDDETFDDVEDNELGGTYIWVTNMEDSIELDAIKLDHLKDAVYSDNLEQFSINDFFGKEDGQRIEQAILTHYKDDKPYEIKASNTEFLTNSVPHFVAHREIGEMAIKSKENKLTKKDVLEFSKVLDNPKVAFEYCELDYLEQPFTRVFNRNKVNQKPKEFAAFQAVFEKLNLNAKKLGKLKSMELER